MTSTFIRLTSVSKTFQKRGTSVRALHDIHLEIASGEFVAVQGPSGCGKTTLLLTMAGMLSPDTGSILLNSVELTGLSSAKRAEVRAESIGFVFQQFHLMPYLTAYENILAATVARTTDSGESRRKAASIAERFGLTDRLGHLPGELSTGERQRVALARACMNSPKIILADEPTGNLDGDNADIVLSFMRDFSEKGGSVFLVTHDKQAAQKADRTLFMKNGSICA